MFKSVVFGAVALFAISTQAMASSVYIDQLDTSIAPRMAGMTTSLEVLQPVFDAAVTATRTMQSIDVPVGGLSLISQLGDNNNASIEQNGPFNLGIIQQIGYNNFAVIQQTGSSHRAMIYQNGRNNTAIIRQQ